jgi:FRG domain
LLNPQPEAIPTIRISTWTQLIDELYRDSWDPDIGRFRSPFVFRGHCNARSKLTTSLMRFGEGHEDVARLEGHLLRNFTKYAHAESSAVDSVWTWLAVAQHHGLHTRLLDWTFSPFVALHFATDDPARFDVDAAIWCVNIRETNRLLPDVLRRAAEDEGSMVFTVDMLTAVAPTLDDFHQLSRDEFVLFMEPPSLDARIVNQYALFSLMSSPTGRLDDWLADHQGVSRKVIIPPELKWEVRDKLDQANINERMLFPGLDGLSRWLSRYYKPKRR